MTDTNTINDWRETDARAYIATLRRLLVAGVKPMEAEQRADEAARRSVACDTCGLPACP